jgi:short-subunit dehydrogenase
MRMKFGDQVAVVTGASSGIGRALAKRLAVAGCKVGLIARRGDELSLLAAEIIQFGRTAEYAVADVADRAATLAAFRDLAGRLGPVDLLVANAGVGAPTLLDPINVGDVEKMVRVNLLGVVYCIEAVLPDMLRRGNGHIAGVSSLAAYKGLPGESGYCASKAGLSSYLEGLRIQLRGRGVTVTTINPGFIVTPMTEKNTFKMPFLLSADAAARRIVGALRRRVKVYDFPRRTAVLMKLMRWLPDRVVAALMQSYNAAPPMPDRPL